MQNLHSHDFKVSVRDVTNFAPYDGSLREELAAQQVKFSELSEQQQSPSAQSTVTAPLAARYKTLATSISTIHNILSEDATATAGCGIGAGGAAGDTESAGASTGVHRSDAKNGAGTQSVVSNAVSVDVHDVSVDVCGSAQQSTAEGISRGGGAGEEEHEAEEDGRVLNQAESACAKALELKKNLREASDNRVLLDKQVVELKKAAEQVGCRLWSMRVARGWEGSF